MAERGSTRRAPRGLLPLGVVLMVAALCLGTLPWTAWGGGGGRYAGGETGFARMGPWWWPERVERTAVAQRDRAVPEGERAAIASRHGVAGGAAGVEGSEDAAVRAELEARWPRFWLGSDLLGRSLLLRLLVGGAVSLVVGLGAAGIAVVIGVGYGAAAGYAGGRVDAVMMRVVDILYGLPTVLLVVLLAVASDAGVDRYVNRNAARHEWVVSRVMERAGVADRAGAERVLAGERGLSVELETEAAGVYPPRELPVPRAVLDLLLLFAAIGGVGWLTMARVIRGQVMSLKGRPFVEAARAVGASPGRIFLRHLLPNLVGPIVVYGTLMVPQAMLQESFLSFLGMGVKAPLPSWGTLCADALPELNPYRSHWWLLVFPCVMLGGTLLMLNFVGEGLRERLDPKGKGR